MIGGLKKTSCYLLAGAAALGVLISGAPAVKAQGLTEAQYQRLKRELKDELAQDSDVDMKVKWKGAPTISSRDGKFSFKVGGRLQLDYNSINQDRRITGDPDVNAWEARRARLNVSGHVWYDWDYKFEVDFAGSDVSVKDAYMAYSGFGDWHNFKILFGQFKLANTLEGYTSSRFITFMERAAFIEAFDAEPRRLGVGIHAGSNDDFGWSFQTSYNGNAIGAEDIRYPSENLFAVRGTIAPVNTDQAVIHLGGSYRHRNAGSDDGPTADLYDYRARGANLHLADRFVDTEDLGEADDYWGLEGAAVWRRFSVQGEYAELTPTVPTYITSMTTRSINPTYNGWYAYGSFFLTDDSRAPGYSAKKGAFGRVKPKNPFFNGSGGWGAWEIAGRYDTVDLGSDASALTDAGHDCEECGDQGTWLIGLNWYPTSYTRLMFNVTSSDIGGVFDVNDGATIDGFGMRGQIDW